MTAAHTLVMEEKACAAALAELPGMGPSRLRSILAGTSSQKAWRVLSEGGAAADALLAGCGPISTEVRQHWRQIVATANPQETLARYQARDISVLVLGCDDYPALLAADAWAPAVLFAQGDQSALANERVAIIGTRHCTHEGRDIARRFGCELAEAGVAVVSGLALGIDGAAHRGALEAAYGAQPVAVVGNGLDVPYPRQHSALWREIASRGLLLSEAPLGARPDRWRFPARNRIIAALAQVLVVVESHEKGGSLLTVDEAAQRGVDVLAVPGPIRSPASAGTNALLRDGGAPVCNTDDVLMALPSRPQTPVRAPSAASIVVAPEDAVVLGAVGTEVVSTEQVLIRTSLPMAAVATSLNRLQQAGLIDGGGGWWRRVRF